MKNTKQTLFSVQVRELPMSLIHEITRMCAADLAVLRDEAPLIHVVRIADIRLATAHAREEGRSSARSVATTVTVCYGMELRQTSTFDLSLPQARLALMAHFATLVASSRRAVEPSSHRAAGVVTLADALGSLQDPLRLQPASHG